MFKHGTVALVCLCLGLWTGLSRSAESRAPSEYSVKAGYLLLFTRYIEWPADAQPNASAPIVICILGKDPFGSVLDRTFENQQSHHRPLQVRRIDDVEAARDCQVVFISEDEASNQQRWLEALAREPVVTVTEDPSTFAHGAILSFVEEGENGRARIRFDASVPAMQRARLKISAQMLVAARKVHRDADG